MSSPEHAKESRKGRLPMLEAKKLFLLVLILTRGKIQHPKRPAGELPASRPGIPSLA